MGVVLGFLPCGLLYGAIAAAAASGSALGGALGMAAFTLGTLPGLWAIGLIGHVVSQHWKASVTRWAPGLLLLNAGGSGLAGSLRRGRGASLRRCGAAAPRPAWGDAPAPLFLLFMVLPSPLPFEKRGFSKGRGEWEGPINKKKAEVWRRQPPGGVRGDSPPRYRSEEPPPRPRASAAPASGRCPRRGTGGR
nr:sulfite exporter TauE/SafE family protein [Pararhodospirillum photometricum]